MYRVIPINPAGGELRLSLVFPTRHFIAYELTLRQGQYSFPVGIGDNEAIAEDDIFILPAPASTLLPKALWCSLVIRRTPMSLMDRYEVRFLLQQGKLRYPPVPLSGILENGEAQRLVLLKFVEAR